MINLKVLTPNKEVLNERVKQVTLSTEAGVITVLRGHLDLITNIKAGEMIIKGGHQDESLAHLDKNKDKKIQVFATYNGVAKIHTTNGRTDVTIMLDSVEDVALLDEENLKSSIERAKEVMLSKDIAEFDLYENKLEAELNKFKILKKYKK